MKFSILLGLARVGTAAAEHGRHVLGRIATDRSCCKNSTTKAALKP